MPMICDHCENQEFRLMDGIYYCTMCGLETERQVTLDVTGQAEFETSAIINTQEEHIVDYEPESDAVKPWLTLEAYQIGLKAFSKALIDLGCPPELDSVVQQIWYAYLSAYKYVDFSGNEENQKLVETKRKNWKFRDTFVKEFQKTGMNLPSGEVKVCAKQKLKYINARRKNSAKKRRLSESDASIDKNEEAESDYESEVEIVSEVFKKHTLHKKGRRDTDCVASDYLHHFNLPVFCFIALQHINEILITPSDFIYLSENCILPHYKIFSLLPKHMLVTERDATELSSTGIITYERFLLKANFIRIKLELPIINKDCLILVSRYLHMLNLPLSLLPICRELRTAVPYPCEAKISLRTAVPKSVQSRYSFDAFSVAIIIVAMKILFDFTDNFEEVELSECDTHTNCAPFSIDKWFMYNKNLNFKNRRNLLNFYSYTDDPRYAGKVKNAIDACNNRFIGHEIIDPERLSKKLRYMQDKRKKIHKSPSTLIQHQRDAEGFYHNWEEEHSNSGGSFLHACIHPYLKNAHNKEYQWNSAIGNELDIRKMSFIDVETYSEKYKRILEMAHWLTLAPAFIIEDFVLFVEEYAIKPHAKPVVVNNSKTTSFKPTFFNFMNKL